MVLLFKLWFKPDKLVKTSWGWKSFYPDTVFCFGVSSSGDRVSPGLHRVSDISPWKRTRRMMMLMALLLLRWSLGGKWNCSSGCPTDRPDISCVFSVLLGLWFKYWRWAFSLCLILLCFTVVYIKREYCKKRLCLLSLGALHWSWQKLSF